MSLSGTENLFAVARRYRTPLLLIVAATVAVIAAITAMNWVTVAHMRESSLKAAEGNLVRRSLTLAEQADRAIQAVDVVLRSVADHMTRQGVGTAAEFVEKMTSHDTYLLLRDKITSMPQLDAITMIDADGYLINFSRYWPTPDINVADRDYFKALRNDPSRQTFISRPVQNRGNGIWNIYLAHRVNDRNGAFAGLVLGAMAVSYFEDFYKSIRLGKGNGVGLYRLDETALVRVPAGANPDTILPATQMPPDMDWVTRETFAGDGKLRLAAMRKLRSFPLAVLTTQSEDSALAYWRSLNSLSFIVLIAVIALVLAAATALALWYLSQQRAGQAERARAAAEAEMLRQQERLAEAASHAKSAFLATMSHEIRTPMNALLGLASTLLESELDADQRADVLAMQNAGDNLLRILNDILDFSKLEAGKFVFETMPFSPGTMTADVVGIIAPHARAKGLALRVTTSADIPAALLGDPGRIQQVLINLLSNAVKFTSDGEVTVDVRVLAREADAATVEWSIKDTGIGIAPDQLATLFGDFVQADTSISRRFGGSGLGLAICRRIVEQMGGSIQAASEPGQGTVFRVRLTLPLAADLPAVARADAPSSADLHRDIAGLGRPLRILLAEDTVTNQMVAVKMLKEFDCRIDIAADGRQAVEAVSGAAYDLVLMDVRMPEMDGLQAAQAIRRKGGGFRHIPIIAMTANAFADDMASCHAAGMTDFVAKPVRKRALVEAIRRAVAADAGPACAEAPAVAPRADQVFDAAVFAELCDAVGEEGADATLRVFLAETAARLEQLGALSCGPDDDTIRIEAHTLKGAAGTLGFCRLSALAGNLEAATGSPLTAGRYDAALADLVAAFALALNAVRADGDGSPATRAAAPGLTAA